ncbi:MAG: putative lipid II flippase FtsW [Actinomycetota bacterium]|nr:putative lipid II flippase FtsW [Actinomycetota bacterium]
MATASEEKWRIGVDASGFRAALKRILDKPLTSYHLVLGVSGLLLSLGLLMVLSASSVTSLNEYGNSYAIFTKQAIWVCVGVPLALVASRLPIGLIRFGAWPALVVSVVLIAMTYVPGFGVSVNGNQNWLSFGGPFQIQPSELAKLAMVLWCADVYSRKDRLLTQWRHVLVPMMPVCALVVAMVVLQGDLGTALVLFAIVLGVLWVIGAPARLFLGSLLVVSVLAFGLAVSQPERVARLTGFLNPIANYGSQGWQASHGFFALATGGLWGSGIGASSQKWGNLPGAHTDFIFAIIGEEFGLFGTLAVLGLFVTLAYVGIRIAARTPDLFVKYASAGIVVWLLSQTLINIGMVLGLLPVIGIPLPLVSYGGSALVPTLVALGLLLSFARTEPGAPAALRARRLERRRRRSRLSDQET